MKRSAILAVLAIGLVTPLASSASPIWIFHATQPFTGNQLVGTCGMTGAGNCTFSLDGGPEFSTAAPNAPLNLTSTALVVSSIVVTGTQQLFDTTLYLPGPSNFWMTLHDDQGVAFAGVPNTPPDLSLLEGASIQFSTYLTPTPELYEACPSCGGVRSRDFTIDSLTSVPESVPGALALVGLLCLALIRLRTASFLHRGCRFSVRRVME